MSSLTVRGLLAQGIVQLERAAVPSAALAAELLLMHTLCRDRAWIYAHPEFEPAAAEREKYFALLSRRAAGEPTQHLTGHQEFWGLDFEVTPDVLVPRPETEHVIEVALSLVAQASAGGNLSGGDRSVTPADPTQSPRTTADLRIADVGTGSGCIAIALAHEFPNAKILATDISPAALQVAQRNANRHAVAGRIEFVETNLLEAVLHGSRFANHGPRSFDLVVSNPPYIGLDERESLAREVLDHEPALALYGGETGAEMYPALIEQAAALLKPGGFLVLELGHRSAQQLLPLLSAPQWTDAKLTNDLAGIARVASARRSEV